MKENPQNSALLSYFDTSVGVNPLILKLYIGIHNKWRDRAVNFKVRNNCAFPPFSFFLCIYTEKGSKAE